MRVLVTGAAGFLGSHIAKALVARGDEVVGLDVVPHHVQGGSAVQASILDRDLADRDDLRGPFDCVIHMAAIAAPGECSRDPDGAFRINVYGTYNMLRFAAKYGARFIFGSSAHVYGIPPKRMPTSEDEPLGLHDDYTISKILGEGLCERFHQVRGLAYVSLRLYNGYGPGQPKGYFIPDILAQAQKGDITLRGGATTKDFLYITDLVRAVVAATTTTFIGALNIGSGRETTLQYVADRVAWHVGVHVEANLVGGVDTRMQCDRTRASRVLGWVPEVGLEAGLDATIAAALEVVENHG